MSDDARTAAGQSARVDPRLVLLVCSGATFMAFLDVSVVNVAFPDMLERFNGPSLSALTWVVSSYAITFAALLTAAGRVADTFGRTRVFLWAAAAFTVASVLCAAAPTVEALVAARFVQGAAAAGMIPAALGLVLSTTPRERLMAAIGLWAAAAGASAAIGPALGGVLAESFSWRSVFVINVPIGVAIVLAGFRVLPLAQPRLGKLPDLPGTLAVTVGLAFVVGGLTQGGGWGWTSPAVLGLLLGGVALVAIGLARSRRHESPAVDIALWRSNKFAKANLVSLVFGTSMYAWMLAGPLFAVSVWNWSVMTAALSVTPGAVAAAVVSTLAGRLRRPGADRYLTIAGVLLFATASGFMATDLLGSEPRFWAVWLPAGLLGGSGMGLAITGVSTAAASAVPPQQFAAGVGLNMTARQLGAGLGTAGFAAVMASVNSAQTIDGFHTAYAACAAVAIVAALAALGLTDRAPAAVAARGAKTAGMSAPKD
jgi:EmrB/QacA subfamily drug resistance transporter